VPVAFSIGATAVGTGLAVRHAAVRHFLCLIERGFYAAFLTWIFLVSLRLSGA